MKTKKISIFVILFIAVLALGYFLSWNWIAVVGVSLMAMVFAGLYWFIVYYWLGGSNDGPTIG